MMSIPARPSVNISVRKEREELPTLTHSRHCLEFRPRYGMPERGSRHNLAADPRRPFGEMRELRVGGIGGVGVKMRESRRGHQ